MCICGEGAGCMNQAPMEATDYGSWRQAGRHTVVTQGVDTDPVLDGEDGDDADE